MFLLRSAFWLTVAFMVMAPKDADFAAAAADLAGRAVVAGQEIVTAQVLGTACSMPICKRSEPALAAVSTTSNPSLGSPMQDSPSEPVPFPRPRPDWMG